MLKELNQVISRLKILNKGKGLSPEEEICRETLLNYTTYRLPSSAASDPFIALRMYIRVIKRIFGTQQFDYQLNNSHSAILAPGLNQKDKIVEHIELQSKSQIGRYLVKDHLKPQFGFFAKLILIARLKMFLVYVLGKTLFSSNRQRLALQLVHAFEISSLLMFLKKNEISTLYDFAGFHIDSNLISLFLSERGIKSIKSPSPGPLVIHYKHLLCHTICYSNPYQLEELEQNSATMIFQEKVKWKPQMSHLYIKQYLKDLNQSSPNLKSLGFYSHGEWIRRILGHSDVGRGTFETENFILQCLKDFLKNRPDYSLKIYPHPLEKREENLEKTQAYYKEKLGGVDFVLAGRRERTVDDFNSIDIALVAASTLIYERLFCGKKLFIGMLPSKNLFHDGSQLIQISFESLQEMEKLILTNQGIPNDSYFKTYQLEGFHYKSY